MIGERVVFYKDMKGVVKDKFCGLDSYSFHTGKPSPYGGEIVEERKITVDFYLILGDDGKTYRVRCSEVNLINTRHNKDEKS